MRSRNAPNASQDSGVSGSQSPILRTLAGVDRESCRFLRLSGFGSNAVERDPIGHASADRRWHTLIPSVRSMTRLSERRTSAAARIWHETSRQGGCSVHSSGSAAAKAEKLALGRPSFAAFDLAAWAGIADALGLALYTNSGYPDMGHGSIEATVEPCLSRAPPREGCVRPGRWERSSRCHARSGCVPTISARSRARWIHGRMCMSSLEMSSCRIYRANPGKIVTAQGESPPSLPSRRCVPCSKRSKSTASSPVKPVLYLCPDAMAARGNERIGSLNAALYHLADDFADDADPARRRDPCARTQMSPSCTPDGTVIPHDENLTRLFRQVPAVDTEAPFGLAA